jgi:hypothetical protein
MDLAPCQIPVWNLYGVLCIQDTHCRIPGILSTHTLLQLESKVQGLAYRKHWNPGRQPYHTGGFL